jgi:hypothetical protein
LIFHDASVPLPFVRSTLTVSAPVPGVYAVTWPSIQFVGVTVFDTRSRWPT